MSSSPRGPSPRPRRLALGTLVAAVLFGGVLASVAAAASSRPAMCERRYAVDYAAPLAALPAAHPPPEGELRFGPRNFSIHRIERSQLALQGTNFGYGFAAKNSGYRVIQLGWAATATLRRVDARGHAGPVIARRGWRVGAVKDVGPLQVAFPAAKPGFFRVDLRFKTLGGRVLGAYRDYFRVLKRSVDVDIAVSGSTVRAGEAIYGQIENRGAGRVIGDEHLAVERFDAGTWSEVPQPPNPLELRDIGVWLESGEVAHCYRYEVPSGALPGFYRFSALAHVAPRRQQRTVTGSFQVVP